MQELIPILHALIPIVAILTVGGLIGLRLLKPYGERIFDLLEESSESRREVLKDDRELRRIHERLDLLSERQEFLEALLDERSERRLEEAAGTRKGRADDAGREGEVGTGGQSA